MIQRVGLTGGLASGKSAVAQRLMERGFPVLDADRVVRDLYRAGRPGARAIAAAFGPGFLDPSGAVNRPKLARHVFGNPEHVALLNATIHPLVLEEEAAFFGRLEKNGAPMAVVEAALLVESGGRDRYDLVVVVSAPERTRLLRAAERTPDVPPEELMRRIEAQMSDPEREEAADFVIRNVGTLDELAAKADILADELAKKAGTGP